MKNTRRRITKLIEKGVLHLHNGSICYGEGEAQREIFRIDDTGKLTCTFFGEPFEYIPREDSRRRTLLHTAPDHPETFLGLSNAFEKKVGGHTHAFYKNGDYALEQSHFTKRLPSWFRGRASYLETLVLTCRGMVAERVHGGFESGGFGFDNAIMIPCSRAAVSHYEIDQFLDALSQQLGVNHRMNYNALSLFNGTNCVRHQLRAFEKAGVDVQNMFRTQKRTWSPWQLARKIEQNIRQKQEPCLRIHIAASTAEICFATATTAQGQSVIHVSSKGLKRSDFPNRDYNISPDMLLSLAQQSDPELIAKLLQGTPMPALTFTEQELRQHYHEDLNQHHADASRNHSHTLKIPYRLGQGDWQTSTLSPPHLSVLREVFRTRQERSARTL